MSKKLNNRNIVIIRWSHYYLVPHLPQTQKDFRGAFLLILSLFLTTISLILTIWILTNWLLRLRLKSNRKNSSNHCLESVPYQDHVKQEYSRVEKTIVHITGWLNKFWNTFGIDFQIILQSLLYLLEFSRFSLTLSLYIKGPIFLCLLMYIS